MNKLMRLALMKKSGGGDDGEWLFKDEPLTDQPRYDLPRPEPGIIYGCYIDGGLIDVSYWDGQMYAENSDTGFEDNMSRLISFQTQYFEGYDYWVFFEYGGWYFHPVESRHISGLVSIKAFRPDSAQSILTHVYLDNQGVARVKENFFLQAAYLELYNADTGKMVASDVAYSTSFDFSVYMEKGKKYYVLMPYYSYNLRSNTIVYNALNDKLKFVFNSSYPTLVGEKQFTRADWELYYVDTGEKLAQYSGPEKSWDCSDYIEGAMGYTYRVIVKVYNNNELIEEFAESYQFI